MIFKIRFTNNIYIYNRHLPKPFVASIPTNSPAIDEKNLVLFQRFEEFPKKKHGLSKLYKYVLNFYISINISIYTCIYNL